MALSPYTGVPATAPSGPSGRLSENIQSSSADFGGLSGAAEQRLGASEEGFGAHLMQSAIGQQEIYNRAAVQDATNKALDIGNNVLYDPKTGYLVTQQKNAMELYHPTIEKIKSGFQGIRDGLLNDAQRAAFDADSRRYLYYYTHAAGSHADQQAKSWADLTDNATRANAISTSATNYNNDAMTWSNVNRIHESITLEAQRKGWSPETVEFERQKELSKFALRQLQAQSVTDGAGALQRYFTGTLPGAPVPDPNNPGKFIQPEIPIRSVIDGAGVEGFIKPLIEKQKAEAIAKDVQRRMGLGVPDDSSGSVPSAIRRQATSLGIDPNIPLTVAKLESNTGNAPDAPGNSHKGVFQLGPTEWAMVGGTSADRDDPIAQATRGTSWVVGSQRAASAALGRPAEGWETYITHQQGSKGGPALLKAPPDQSAVDALAPAYGGNRATATRAITGNGGTANMTAGQFLSLWRDKYTATSGAPAAPTAPITAEAAPRVIQTGIGDTMLPPGAPTMSPLESELPDIDKIVEGIRKDYPNILDQEKAVAQARNQYNMLLLNTQQQRDDLLKELPNLRAKALNGQDIVLPESQIRHVLPPALAAREIEKLGIARDAGQQFKAAQWGTPGDVAVAYRRLSEGLGPDPRGARVISGALHGTAEEGDLLPAPTDEQSGTDQYRYRQQIRNAFVHQIQERNRGLLTNAMAYIGQHPDMQAAARAVAAEPNNPQRLQNFYNTALNVQSYLGVPQDKQHILTKDQAGNLANTLSNGDPTSFKPIQAFKELEQTYGPHWKKAFGDLVSLGSLPGFYQVLAAMDQPDQAGAATRLQIAMGLAKEKGGFHEVAKSTGKPTEVADIDKDVGNQLADFHKTVAFTPGGMKLFNDVETATKLLAYTYVTEGKTASQALSAAVDDIFNKKYDFHGTWRSEKKYSESAAAAAYWVPRNLTSEDLAPVGGGQYMSDADRKSAVLAGIKSSGAWLNNPDESGIYLTYLARGIREPVRRADGSLVQINFVNPPQRPSMTPDSRGELRGQPPNPFVVSPNP